MVTVVSGLPRSGTSLMMQMLEAGGMSVLIDDQRPSDDDNPRGYYEYAPVKRLDQDNVWLAEAEGRAVKIVTPLLHHLPANLQYRVIIMQRDLDEVLRSQEAMLQRLGEPPGPDPAVMRRHFERFLEKSQQWLSQQTHIDVLECPFANVVTGPQPEIARIADFLKLELDQQAMAGVVQPQLYRQRAGTNG